MPGFAAVSPTVTAVEPHRWPALAAGLALSATVLAVASSLAAALAPGPAAETVYLGLLTALVVAALVAAAPRSVVTPAWVALLVALALWVLPTGAVRGAAVLALLVGGLLAAVARRLGAAGTAGAASLVPLALAAQLLLRGNELLAPWLSTTNLVHFVALPLVGGLATAALARRRPAAVVVPAVGAALLLAPGFNAGVTLALVALAAGEVAFSSTASRRWRLATLALLVAPLIWEPRAALVAALAALTLAGGPVAAAGAGAGGLALALGLPLRPWGETALLAAGLPLLVPALLAPPRRRWPQLAAGLVLALAALRAVPGEAALTAPLLVVVLLSVRRRGSLAVLQRSWLALLFAGTALAASYPWLRPVPVADALAAAGLAPSWPTALALLAAVAAIALIWKLPYFDHLPSPGLALMALVGLHLLLTLPAAGWRPLDAQGALLVEGMPQLSLSAPAPQSVSEVIVDSHLANAADLAAGTPVATVVLLADGEPVDRWVLRAGRDTGEWAAQRADLAALPELVTPPPWRGEMAPGGRFFALRYRGRWSLAAPQPAVSGVVVRRNPKLPADVELVLFRLELRR